MRVTVDAACKAKIAAHVRVARFARLRAHSAGAGNHYVFSEISDPLIVRFFLCHGGLGGEEDQHQNCRAH
jgi:hypothetical protein